MAHKNGYRDIVKLLLESKVGDDSTRNHRGLIPIQMNHKKIFLGDIIEGGLEEEFDAEPDYVFIVKKQRAAFLIS